MHPEGLDGGASFQDPSETCSLVLSTTMLMFKSAQTGTRKLDAHAKYLWAKYLRYLSICRFSLTPKFSQERKFLSDCNPSTSFFFICTDYLFMGFWSMYVSFLLNWACYFSYLYVRFLLNPNPTLNWSLKRKTFFNIFRHNSQNKQILLCANSVIFNVG